MSPLCRPLAASALMLSLALAVTPAHAQSPPDSTGGLPYVTRIFTDPAIPNAHERTRLMVQGYIGNACLWPRAWSTVDPGHVTIDIGPIPPCIDPPGSWGVDFDLGALPAGPHAVDILLRLTHPDPNGGLDSTVTEHHARFTFEVLGDSLPPPPGPLPYVDRVDIGPAPPHPGPICTKDSILVHFSGTFPNTCYRVARIQLIPSPIVAPFPVPPIVGLVIDECVRQVCLPGPTPWDAYVTLPPLPIERPYGLSVLEAKLACADSLPGDSSTFHAEFPFTVVSCAVQVERCVAGLWAPSADPQCNGSVAPGQPARIDFAVASSVALAGLQGEFHVDPPQLVVTGIEAIGPAAGMHVQWRPSPDGAKFTMFAEHGAPIPPAGRDSIGSDSLVFRVRSVPILRLTLRQTGPLSVPVTSVHSSALLGSDERGLGVPECPLPFPFPRAEAHVCSERNCDVNHDGHTDVRDLVLMVHCVAGVDSGGAAFRTACTDSNDVPDCNRDGRHSIEDVLCCGRRILRGDDCPDCPNDSTPPRPAPEVRASLGAPVFGTGGVRIPITLDGLGGVGGALLRLSYPSDRYDAAIDVPLESNNWLMLSDVNQGVATLGAIRLGDPPPDQALAARFVATPLELRLTLKAGQSHGGTVAIQSSEFSGTDGAMLATTRNPSPQPLGGAPSLALSAAQPNPFNGTTRFQLTLDRRGSAEVGIYDLGGRLVARLHRGTLDAGAHDFTWNGVRDGGGAAANGVYFYRATSGTTTVSRKMVRIGN